MDHVGIDLHKRESQICIETELGEVIEKRIRTERERFEAVFAGRPRARILIEAMTEAEWVARCLEVAGARGGGGRPQLRCHVRDSQPPGEDR